jgi:sugar-specific transcriptional regulator TrmB
VDIPQRLAAAGFGANEAKVYVAVAELGSAPAAEVARRAGLKRPTVYGLLERLVAKGVVSVGVTGRGRVYAVDSPRRLLELPRRQEAALRELIPELAGLRGDGVAKPRIRLHEGREGIVRVNEDLLTTRSGEYHYLGGMRDMAEVLGKPYLEDYVRRRVAAGIRSWAIRVRSRELAWPFLAEGERWLRRVRLLDEPIAGDLVGLYVYDQRIAIVSTLREGYGLVIESAQLAATIMLVWRTLWNVARPAR